MIRLLAAAVVAAALVSLGVDLTQTAYTAHLTARSVTLATLSRA